MDAPNLRELTEILSNQICKYVDISTIHVSPHDLEILKEEWVTVDYPEGCFCWVPPNDAQDFDSRMQELKDMGLTPQCLEIINASTILGCVFVRFDCDGEISEDIPKNEDW
jgi:hypothetical protein